METFKEKFGSRYHLPEVDVQTLFNRMEEISFRKKKIIVREGTKDNCLYLIKQGIWRAHYHKEDTDITIWFATEGDVAFSVWGYVDNSYSMISIEAMCDGIAYRISRSDLLLLYSSSIGLANLGRILMEHQMFSMENWLVSSGSPRAKERYLTLIKEMPEILQYVPLKYIASYLWVTPQSLSRIRASL